MGMTRLEQLYLTMEVASWVCSPTMMWPCRMSCFLGPAVGLQASTSFAGLSLDMPVRCQTAGSCMPVIIGRHEVAGGTTWIVKLIKENSSAR